MLINYYPAYDFDIIVACSEFILIIHGGGRAKQARVFSCLLLYNPGFAGFFSLKIW